MQVTETLSDGLKRAFTVVVPAADVEGKRAAKLAEIGKTVRLPGFRPGKVPMPVLRQRYGNAAMAEALEESVTEATQQVLTDRGLRPAMQPKVDLVQASPTSDIEFKVELELLPDITMPEFSAIELVRLKTTPSEAALDLALAQIAARQRELTPVTEDRGAAKGEVLEADYVGRIDGTAFEGGTATDAKIEVAGTGFIPGFSEQLEGQKVGETRTIEVTFPAGYGAADLAGKTAHFEITAKALSAPAPVSLDDELAKKLGFESLSDVREVITRQMQREYDQMSRQRIKRQLLDALAQHHFGVPDSMVGAEFEQIWQRVEADRAKGEADAEDAGKDTETLKAEYRAIAERRVRLGLLLSEIGRANGIAVGADEMTRAMRAEASRYPGQEATVIEFFRKNPQAAEGLRGPIFEDKVVDFVFELAKVEDREVTVEELAAEPSPESAAEQASPSPAA